MPCPESAFSRWTPSLSLTSSLQRRANLNSEAPRLKLLLFASY
jgi:hypothetical protein